ncbi:MAG TPA: hypothetical protein VFL57_18605 [Bryobacteraceae bacterium]|nr:hypothetical protein [Bryobacteraceae bacterium]
MKALAGLLLLSTAAAAANFGTVVVTGGQPSDLALDERRGLLYIANFTGNRIDVMSTSDNRLGNAIRVPGQPNSLALSADGRYLVVAHYRNFAPPCTPQLSELTVLDLDGNVRQSVALTAGTHPLTVAFGNSPRAFVVTTSGLMLLDPAAATLAPVPAPPQILGGNLSLPFASFPPQVLKASSTVSGDGDSIHVLAEVAPTAQPKPPTPETPPPPTGIGSPTGPCTVQSVAPSNVAVILRYDVRTGTASGVSVQSEPPLGPRVISTDASGSMVMAGWGLLDQDFVLRAQLPRANGAFALGGHAYDFSRGLIYANVPPPGPTGTGAQAGQADGTAVRETAVLHVMDADNLTVRERLQLAENLGGKSVFSRDMQTLYAVSESGVTVLPVGTLDQQRRLRASVEDVLFPANACDRSAIIREITITDASGQRTDFTLRLPANARGIRTAPSAASTPARVRIEVDPTAFQQQKGTAEVPVEIVSAGAVNLHPPVRLLINTREPEQKGRILNVPGKLVDILADPVRDRLYVIRQDRNELLVFDGTTFERIATLRTGNTPTQMALTRDNRYMMVGNDNSQYANVYDLETLQPSQPITFPLGLYPRSIAAVNGAIWATARAASPPHRLLRIDFARRVATAPDVLGVFANDINVDSVLAASPSGRYMFLAMPDGTVVLYDSDFDAFSNGRKDATALGGAYSVLDDDAFVVGSYVLNRSLVPRARLQGGDGSGLSSAGGFGLRVSSTGAAGPGIVERMDLNTFGMIGPRQTIEAPMVAQTLRTPAVGQIGQTILPFTRTLAPLSNGRNIVVRSVSGLTVLPWDFQAGTATPMVSGIVNMADFTDAVAPGAIVSISGSSLADDTAAASEAPLPTSLADVCLSVNNIAVPLFSVAPNEIRAQLPNGVAGSAQMVVRTSGGTSSAFAFNVLPSAPAIFRTGTAGEESGLPLVYRAANEELVTFTNPVRVNDVLVIYGTGIGATSPEVTAGFAAPRDTIVRAVNELKVTLGGVPVRVDFAGLAPGAIGVYQLNVAIPPAVPEGREVPLTITAGTYSTTINVRVVKP